MTYACCHVDEMYVCDICEYLLICMLGRDNMLYDIELEYMCVCMFRIAS